MNFEIILPLSFDHGFDYYDDKHDLSQGDLVIVNFKGKEIIGVVKGPGTSGLPPEKLKPIVKKLSFSLNINLYKFLNKVADYNLAPLGEVYRMAIGNIEEKTLISIASGTSPEYHPELFTLNSFQQQCYQDILRSTKNTILLEGVTGSGKTEIYFSLIECYLKQGQQILLLMPEIALTTQIVKRFTERFKNYPILWHSSLTPKQKRENLGLIVSGKASVVIGARSSLFLPFNNLGLIIVDEEHDPSYKQDDLVCYHARNMAVLRGSIENIKVVLGSATPALESIVNVQNEKYDYYKLEAAYVNQEAKNIIIADLKKDKLPAGQFISKTLLTKIAETLAKDEQALLFLNRRGFSPLMLCRECGFRITCPDCSSWLVYHKNLNKLVCHHCGFQRKAREQCDNCHSEGSLVACGPGVERIEEEIREKFPLSRIININTDNISTPKQIEKIFQQILNNQFDIIIGTQMISKGLDFPNLTLVGVVDADIGLGGDLRAIERNYQIINQVLGRAGRHKPGVAIIQTYEPENKALQAIARNNIPEFIQQEIESRRLHHMPPFARLAALVISSLNENILQEFAKSLVRNAPLSKEVEIFGPAPALIYRLRNRYRLRILVKSSLKFNLQSYLKAWLQKLKKPGTIRIKIDIDPYNFS